jgi:hypothetical protein
MLNRWPNAVFEAEEHDAIECLLCCLLVLTCHERSAEREANIQERENIPPMPILKCPKNLIFYKYNRSRGYHYLCADMAFQLTER